MQTRSRLAGRRSLKQMAEDMAGASAGELADTAVVAVAELAAQAGDPESEMPAEEGLSALVEVAVAAVDAIAAEAGNPDSDVPAEAGVEALAEVADAIVEDIATEAANPDSEVAGDTAAAALEHVAESATAAAEGVGEGDGGEGEEPPATSAAHRRLGRKSSTQLMARLAAAQRRLAALGA